VSPFRLLLAAVAVSLALPAATAEGAVGDEIVVARQPGLSAAERADVLADAGVELERTLPLRDTEVVSAPAGERADALAALRADPGVRWAEPNRPRSIASTDPYWPRLWGLENTGQTVLGASGVADADIDAPEAWTLTKGRGVTVAVVDTGVAAHPDLSVVPGWDFVEDGVPGHSDTYTTTWMTDKALDWVGKQGDKPWFLWLAENEPHFPFHRPPDSLQHYDGLTDTESDIEARPRAYVKAQAEALDTEMGRLLASMDPQVRANTTII